MMVVAGTQKQHAEAAEDTAPFLHWCAYDGCIRWGAFGFGVQLLKGHLGQWVCAEHLEWGKTEFGPSIGSPLPRPETAKAASLCNGPKQGSLL